MNKKIYGACLSYKCAKAQKHTKDCPLYGVPYPTKLNKIKKNDRPITACSGVAFPMPEKKDKKIKKTFDEDQVLPNLAMVIYPVWKMKTPKKPSKDFKRLQEIMERLNDKN